MFEHRREGCEEAFYLHEKGDDELMDQNMLRSQALLELLHQLLCLNKLQGILSSFIGFHPSMNKQSKASGQFSVHAQVHTNDDCPDASAISWCEEASTPECPSVTLPSGLYS